MHIYIYIYKSVRTAWDDPNKTNFLPDREAFLTTEFQISTSVRARGKRHRCFQKSGLRDTETRN